MARQSHNGEVMDNLDLYHDVSAALWAALDIKVVEEYQAMADEVNARVTEPPGLSEIFQCVTYSSY